MYKLAVFDMDGTILDTLAGLMSSGNYAMKQLGFPQHELAQYRFFVGNGLRKLLERILPEGNRDIETQARAAALFNAHYGANSMADTRHFEGLPEILQKMKDTGIKLAVASNKPPEFAVLFAEHFFGEGFFECVLGPEGDIPPKPDPKMLLEAIRRAGCSPEETCYFGDSNVDIYTGINAGVSTAGVAWGFRPESELLAAGAERVLHSYSEIAEFAGIIA